MKLVYTKTGEEVKVGDKVVACGNFREHVTVTSIERPRSPASTGRVYVRYAEGGEASYYPSVIDAEWIEREDRAEEN